MSAENKKSTRDVPLIVYCASLLILNIYLLWEIEKYKQITEKSLNLTEMCSLQMNEMISGREACKVISAPVAGTYRVCIDPLKFTRSQR